MDEKKLDEILKNTKQTNMLLESVGMMLNSFVVGIFTVVVLKIVFNKWNPKNCGGYISPNVLLGKLALFTTTYMKRKTYKGE